MWLTLVPSRVEALIARFWFSVFEMHTFGLLFGVAIILVFSTAEFAERIQGEKCTDIFFTSLEAHFNFLLGFEL